MGGQGCDVCSDTHTLKEWNFLKCGFSLVCFPPLTSCGDGTNHSGRICLPSLTPPSKQGWLFSALLSCPLLMLLDNSHHSSFSSESARVRRDGKAETKALGSPWRTLSQPLPSPRETQTLQRVSNEPMPTQAELKDRTPNQVYKRFQRQKSKHPLHSSIPMLKGALEKPSAGGMSRGYKNKE